MENLCHSMPGKSKCFLSSFATAQLSKGLNISSAVSHCSICISMKYCCLYNVSYEKKACGGY